jgi:predicted cobalt transporter CbtA
VVGALLLRGMLVGVVAGVLSFGFLKIVGEPSVDRAIAFEADAAKAEAPAVAAKGITAPTAEPEPELVSRKVQAGIGLFTGVVIYGAALGGLFAIAFALTHGRIGDVSPRANSALLAAAGFVAVYVVPMLKYPANPPAVGAPETIGMRTTLYFSMIALSLAAIVAAGMLRARLHRRCGAWNATLLAGTVYIVAMILVGLALPAVNDVPEQFPAVVLWQFRMAAMGGQSILWATLGLGFGAAVERVATSRGGSRARLAVF